jgi:hypothetical protein
MGVLMAAESLRSRENPTTISILAAINGTSSKWNDLSIKCSAADPSRGFLSSQQESIFQSVPPSAMDMNREGDPRIPAKIHCKSGGSCILHAEANPIQSFFFFFSCSNGNIQQHDISIDLLAHKIN